MAQQGSRPPRSGRLPAPRRPRAPEEGDGGRAGDSPPWAGPGVAPLWADDREAGDREAGDREAGDRRRRSGEEAPPLIQGFRRRLGAARRRRNRRARYIWAGAAVVVAAIAATVAVRLTSGPASSALPQPLVTTFLPGESRTVPDACSAVTPATLTAYLPGKPDKLAPSLGTKAASQCDWTLDARPVYRLLEVTVRAYAPSGLASGDGSATQAAMDAFRAARQQRASPPKSAHMPKGEVRPVHGVGDAAFTSLQRPSSGGDTTDLVTVVVRRHNVLITVVFDGLAHSRNGGYGPVSTARLRAGALAAAKDVLAQVG